MNFTIKTHKKANAVDEAFWKRAFNYAAKELQIEHLHANVVCWFVPLQDEEEENKKFKTASVTLGSTVLASDGAGFVVAQSDQKAKTFFHEMAHEATAAGRIGS